ncbi:MAG: ABC transporter permease, partial [Acidobacteria bacterium]|nr:ABC transporter permease [Acidobacteriota bacterium]
MIVLLALLGQAWRSLRFYGRRSFLTMLGMAWGITTLVMLHAYGVEFEKLVRAGFETFGTKLLVVSGGRTSEQAGGERTGRPIRLQLEDMEYVKATVPLVRDASPQVDQEYLLSYGPRSQKFRVYGVYRVYGRMRRMETGEVRWLNEADEMQRARVAVLGADLKERLFADRPALGESIRIAGISFDVIGVLRKKVGFAGDEDNRVLFIPFSTMTLLRSTRYIEFVAELRHGPVHKDAVKQIRARLGERLAFRPT